MSDQLNRMEVMLATLIRMQASTNARVEELSEEMKQMHTELKAEIEMFREGTNLRFTRLYRHTKLLDHDVDHTMATVDKLRAAGQSEMQTRPMK